MPQLIFKIVGAGLWAQAEAAGVFLGAPVDLADGFIHFSTAEQVKETAARHFAGQTDLVLVAIDADALDKALVWEPSRGGRLFSASLWAFADEARALVQAFAARAGWIAPLS